MVNKVILLFLWYTALLAAQAVDITPYLKEVERGNAAGIRQKAADLLKKYPDDANVQFLDAVLTEDAVQAEVKLLAFAEANKGAKYYDAALFRLYSYYYATGSYKKAKTMLDRLKKDVPDSPYLRRIEVNLPPELEFGGKADTLNRSAGETDEPVVQEDSAAVTVPVPDPPKDTKKKGTGKEKDSTKKDPAPAPDGKTWTVQAGAFMNTANVTALKDRLTDGGYDAFVEKRMVGGAQLDVVFVGRYPSRQEADKVKRELQQKFNIKGRVTTIGG